MGIKGKLCYIEFMKKQREVPDLLTIFQALSDPIRLDIVRCILAAGEKRITNDKYQIAKSTLSHHLKILTEAQLLVMRKEGVARIYQIDQQLIDQAFPNLLNLVIMDQE